jgi:hypothetical protein
MDRGRRTKEYIEQFREVSFLVDGAHLPFAAVIVAAFFWYYRPTIEWTR